MSKTEKKVLLEKRKEVAESKVIGGSEILEVDGVNITREILNFCVCGDRINDNDMVICQWGNEKLCTGCAVEYERKKICLECFQKKFPLSKRQYKFLVCVASGMTSKGKIREITRIPKSEINEALDSLLKSNYIIKKFFRCLQITDKGMEILTPYRIYDSEQDISKLLMELRTSVLQ